MVNLTENLLTMKDVCNLLKVSYETVRTYRDKGIAAGSRIARLHMVRVGRQYRTSREAVHDFLAQTNPDARLSESTQSRSRSDEAADRAMANIRSKSGAR